MRRLTLEIHEPLPGKVLPKIAESHGDDEAIARYRAIAVTTLRQLRGLKDTRIQINCTPADAAEAIRFWILPRLAEQWQADDLIYRSDGWEISFESHGCYHIEATGDILCPFLCARWVHTAMLGLEQATYQAIGPSTAGGTYFQAQASMQQAAEKRILPELPVIDSDEDWQEALNTPLGPALKKAREEETA